MNFEDLLLKKEEIPILHECFFKVPIHPLLFEVDLNPGLAQEVFVRTAKEWYEDLKQYVETAELDSETKKWYGEVFLKERPLLTQRFGRWVFSDLAWEADVDTSANGFATGMSISRNSGGTIYFNESFERMDDFVSFIKPNVGYIRFSPEKAREFGFREMGFGDDKGTLIKTYALHNVDYYPGALFLRNWGINYINGALESIQGI